jgi:hypothetical protein
MNYCSTQGKRPCIFKGSYRKMIKSIIMRWAGMLYMWGRRGVCRFWLGGLGERDDENDERYQLDATILIYYHKYLYMFRAFICPS